MSLSRQNWPVDPGGKDAFYGRPSGPNDAAWQAQNLVPYAVPWTGHSVMVHRLVRASLDRVLTEYWSEIGHDAGTISKYGLADVETYAYRANRNNPSSLSNHSYGIAVDLAPSHQPNGSTWHDGGVMMPRRLIELFKVEGWRWGGDFGGTKDPMHFEAVHDQHHDQPPVPAPQSIASQPTSMIPAGPANPAPAPVLSGLGGELEGIIRAWGIREIGQSPEVVRAKQALQAAQVALDALGQAQATPTAPAPVQRIPEPPTPPVPGFIKVSPTRAKVMGPDLSSNDPGKMTWWLASPIPPPTGATTMSMPSDVGQVFAGSKQWYQSSGIWGAIIAAVSPALGGVLHVSLSSDQAGQLAQALAEVGNVIQVAGPVLGGIVAGIGRVKANTTIGR